MRKKVNLLWILYAAVLIVLFLLSSTDLIIKEKKAEVYPVSVIIEDASDDYYVNFRRGVERAAVELNADVNFITLYEQGNREQQLDMFVREQEDGNRALIVAPVDEEMALELKNGKRITTSLVLLNADEELVKDGLAAGISFDYYEMGRLLGERISEERDPKTPVCLFSCRGHSIINEPMAEGIRSVLEPAGFGVNDYYLQKPDGLKLVLQRISDTEAGDVTLVGLDPESLASAAGLSEDDKFDTSWIQGLYGRGNTVQILNYLDRGVISGLCITDDFSAGYTSVEAAVALMNGKYRKSRKALTSACIGREELRAGTYEKLLYPIE